LSLAVPQAHADLPAGALAFGHGGGVDNSSPRKRSLPNSGDPIETHRVRPRRPRQHPSTGGDPALREMPQPSTCGGDGGERNRLLLGEQITPRASSRLMRSCASISTGLG
jgi:hypothetical protein